jgi:hypothetical protein
MISPTGWIPEFLMYGGNSNRSPLVGFAWYVEGTTTTPPDGFAGGNDWWHRHESLCFNDATFIVNGENISDANTGRRQPVRVGPGPGPDH